MVISTGDETGPHALRASWGEDQFVGGALCLDFANTTNAVPEAEPGEERLVSYPALTHWAVAAGALPAEERGALDALAARHPAAAVAALAQARRLRQAILDLFATAEPPTQALAVVEHMAQAARARQRLTSVSDGFAWTWPASAVDTGHAPDAAVQLERPLWPVALSALDILTDAQARSLTRQCAGPTCSWVFLDTTKNHRRRWCDMATCGNRAKAHRHYVRRRAPSA